MSIKKNLRAGRAYLTFNPQGVGIISASLISFGTPEQQRRWAVPILRAEMTASLGMSETGGRFPIWPRCERVRIVMATTSSSTGRRCGRPAPTTPTFC